MNLNQKHLTPISGPLAVIFAVFAALQTQAHPGHGVFERGLGHAVMSPYHVLTLALCGSVLWAFGYVAKAPIGERQQVDLAGRNVRAVERVGGPQRVGQRPALDGRRRPRVGRRPSSTQTRVLDDDTT